MAVRKTSVTTTTRTPTRFGIKVTDFTTGESVKTTTSGGGVSSVSYSPPPSSVPAGTPAPIGEAAAVQAATASATASAPSAAPSAYSASQLRASAQPPSTRKDLSRESVVQRQQEALRFQMDKARALTGGRGREFEQAQRDYADYSEQLAEGKEMTAGEKLALAYEGMKASDVPKDVLNKYIAAENVRVATQVYQEKYPQAERVTLYQAKEPEPIPEPAKEPSWLGKRLDIISSYQQGRALEARQATLKALSKVGYEGIPVQYPEKPTTTYNILTGKPSVQPRIDMTSPQGKVNYLTPAELGGAASAVVSLAPYVATAGIPGGWVPFVAADVYQAKKAYVGIKGATYLATEAPSVFGLSATSPEYQKYTKQTAEYNLMLAKQKRIAPLIPFLAATEAALPFALKGVSNLSKPIVKLGPKPKPYVIYTSKVKTSGISSVGKAQGFVVTPPQYKTTTTGFRQLANTFSILKPASPTARVKFGFTPTTSVARAARYDKFVLPYVSGKSVTHGTTALRVAKVQGGTVKVGSLTKLSEDYGKVKRVKLTDLTPSERYILRKGKVGGITISNLEGAKYFRTVSASEKGIPVTNKGYPAYTDAFIRLKRYSNTQKVLLLGRRPMEKNLGIAGIAKKGKLGKYEVFEIVQGTKPVQSVFPRARGNVIPMYGVAFVEKLKTPSGGATFIRTAGTITKTRPFPSLQAAKATATALSTIRPPKVIPPKVTKITEGYLTAPKMVGGLGQAGSAYAGKGLATDLEYPVAPLSVLGTRTFGRTITSETERNAQAATSRTETRSASAFYSSSGTSNLLVTPSAISEKVVETTITPSAGITAQVQRPVIKTSVQNMMLEPSPVKPKTPTTTIIPKEDKFSRKLLYPKGSGKVSYVSEVRRFGKFKPVARGKFPKVLAVGIKKVKAGLGASFRIRLGKKIIPIAPPSRMFRLAKREPGVIVQRKTARLTSLGERTALVAARRGVKWF